MLLAKIGKKIFRLCQLLEDPKLLQLKLRGKKVDLDLYCNLDTRWFRYLDINTVIDIGANVGQFSVLIHEILPECAIYAFEPLNECYKKLREKMSEISRFTAYNLALGDTEGVLEFFSNYYSPSSSALPMADLHKQNFPFTEQAELIQVKLTTLDSAAQNIELLDNILINIDVQGYEDKVIRGGVTTIRRAKILIIEISFRPLYDGQPLFSDIYDSLISEGFDYMGSLQQLKSPIDGSTLQEDSLFMKSEFKEKFVKKAQRKKLF